MAVRPMKVWNAATSTWDDVAVSQRGDVILNALVNAKGDLITATANDTPAVQSVGANGEVLYADSSATNGLRWQPVYNAGRNRIINGGFNVWQRGTSFSSPASGDFSADRWRVGFNGTGATRTVSRQAFTVGSPAATGHESEFFYRFDQSVAGSGGTFNDAAYQLIEDVRTFADQTVTVSFYAKADTNGRTITPVLVQAFGLSGSTSVETTGTSHSLTTSWARYSQTITVPSISGKTLGEGSSLQLRLRAASNTVQTIDLWGVQVEAGSVATRFEFEPYEATLRKCQRYYYVAASGASDMLGMGTYDGATTVLAGLNFPTTMRTDPSLVATTGTDYYRFNTNQTDDGFNDLTIYIPSVNGALIYSSANVSGTTARAGYMTTWNAAASVAFSAEL